MKKQFLAAFFGVIVASASAGVFANEPAETAETPEQAQQRILQRMNNISPEDQQRLNERFKAVEAASKAQAEKASEGAEEPNPVCEVVLCLFGKMSGASQSECKSAEKKYFSIIKKKKGKIRWSDTAKERLNFLNGCPSPENDKINDKFGKILG
jgi:methionyl-tRNA formyltransferase